MRDYLTTAAIVAVATAAAPAMSFAEAPPKPTAVTQAEPDFSWQDKLQRQTGEVILDGPKVKLTLGEGYYFIGPDEARRVLVEGWGNPPESANGVLGMIIPTKFKPVAEETWAAVVTFEDVGYVSDKDAGDIKPDKLLTELREGEVDSNQARQKAGYPTIHLAGWAEAPSYHAAGHYAVWAQDLKFGDSERHTLNYDIRVLGRRGVLSLNVVAAMSDLPEVRGAAESIVKTAEFQTGERYADYKEGLDKKAEYGIAGLVAAGLGAAAVKKLGLLAIILAFVKKGIVFLIAGFGALVAWVRRAFTGRSGKGGDNLVS